MKRSVLILLLISQMSFGQSNDWSSHYFQFQNNYWLNLHHFLYQKAKGSQLKKIEEDGRSFLKIGEDSVYQNLDIDESKTLEKAVTYYKEKLIQKDLRRDLGDLRVWLQEQSGTKIQDTTFTQNYTEVLNEFSPVYESRFWPVHQSHNERVLKKYLSLIQELEHDVLKEMETLGGYQWPTESKVRVDITTYANWAGAYAPTEPDLNIIISTIDETNAGTCFIETVFHEGSHLIFSRESSFRSYIYFRSKEREMKFPRSLWHASLFYLCGRSTQEFLRKKGLEHKLLMDELNIFQSYNTPHFRDTLEKYFLGKVDMNTTIDQLLDELAEK